MRRSIFTLATVVALAGPVGSTQVTEGQKLNTSLDRYWEEVLKRNPTIATGIGDPRYNDLFPNDLTEKARAEEKAWVTAWLKHLKGFHRNRLQGQDRISYDILVRDLRLTLSGFRYPTHLLPIDQMGSIPLFFAALGSGDHIHPFKTVKDYEDFLKRGDHIVAWMDQSILNMRLGMKRGIVQPQIVMQKVLPQLDQILMTDPEKSVFWGPFKQMPEVIGAADRERLAATYRRAISERWMPAYRRLRDFVKDDYLPHCRATVGYAQLPDGQGWYAHSVKVATTTDMVPNTIHQVGLQEVKRILEAMEIVKTQVGFQGDLHAFFRHMNEDPAFYFTDAKDLIAGYQALQKKIDSLLPKLFDVFPKYDYVVKPVEAFLAQSAPGGYYRPGTPDGSRPGVFYINTFNLKAQPKFGMETLSLHEASPGHHFQSSIAAEVQGLPKFRRFGNYSAYSEGWALYVESLGKDLGLFTDPYQWYGRLADEQLRAMRLVVDTGIHANGWSREQAIKYMKDNSSMAETDIVAEVERYIVMPGQALSYKLGQFAIRDLRTEAELKLGERFDAKAFHRQLRIDGALPLEVLKTKLREWIISHGPDR